MPIPARAATLPIHRNPLRRQNPGRRDAVVADAYRFGDYSKGATGSMAAPDFVELQGKT
jgi:hypothetical protein